MEPNKKVNVKDLFLNLGAIVALYTVVINLINLLFAVINSAYPQINNGYNYYGSQSISWPVAIIIIFLPIYIFLMWLLEKGYKIEPERRNLGIRKWLSYITLFLAGLATAVDLVTVLYYFLDGQDLTTGFLLKVLSVLIVALGVFMYYISDIRGKLNSSSRKIWSIVTFIVIVSSILWGFSVLGSPRSQRLVKYDEVKVMDLQNITNAIQSYYSVNGNLPKDFVEISTLNYGVKQIDPQTQKPYEYIVKSATKFDVCADFNKESMNNGREMSLAFPAPYGGTSWTHPAGRHCFSQSIDPNMYTKFAPVR